MRKIEKKESNISVLRLVITLVLIVLISIGAFFLARWMINSTKKNDTPDTTEQSEKYHNRLLEMLNDNINKTKMGDEALANEITTFSFKNNHFYIYGFNGATVYKYNLDLSAKGYTNAKDALDFVLDNEIEGKYDITLNRFAICSSEEFNNKFITEGVKGKYHIGQYGEEKHAYATLLKDEQITIISDDLLSDTLNASYSPTIINKNDSLFGTYKYLAEK